VHNKVLGSLNVFSRPWNKTTSKTQTAGEENPTQNLAKQLKTCQELISNTKGQNHMN
jgi:hypothetical protein